MVTGAAAGIGAAAAEAFRSSGWETVGLDKPGRLGPGVVERAIDVDLADTAALEAALAPVERVDALVNNAAVLHVAPLADTDPAAWDHVMSVNVRAAYLSMRALQSRLAASSGAVVNVASVHAVATSADVAAYAASKGAVVALTRAAALEFAADGIRVNAVLPGAVDTAMLRSGLTRSGGDAEAGIADLAGRTPLGRVGQPAEIAHAILFLADGSRSSFVTGQTLIADGGATARLATE